MERDSTPLDQKAHFRLIKKDWTKSDTPFLLNKITFNQIVKRIYLITFEKIWKYLEFFNYE